nr:NadS family protein [Providencia rustigianii]
MSFFNELKTSLEEAVEIKNGEKAASKITYYEVADVKAIREQLNVSQSELANALGTSIDTIKSWELKRRNPTGLAAKVLIAIKNNPALFKILATSWLFLCGLSFESFL